MKFFTTAICLFLTFLNVMQCTCNTVLNFTADAVTIDGVIVENEVNTEQIITDILVNRSNAERQEIAKEYNKLFKKDLLVELGLYFVYDMKEAITALMVPNDHFYAYELHHAIEGFGTDEDAISEILGSLNNTEILNISAIYENDYNTTLKDDLISDTSGSFMELIKSWCNVERDESTEVDNSTAVIDAHALYDAHIEYTNSNSRADISIFKSILTTRSREHLKLVFMEYDKISNSTIVQTIKEDFYSDMQYGLLIIVKSVLLNRSQFYAVQLQESIQGVGTNDHQLIRIIVGRSEIDLKDIQKEFNRIYKMDLIESVADDTSGKYRDLLLSIIRK